MLPRAGRFMLIYAALLGVLGVLYMRLPSSFLPVEDQGYVITDIQLPAGATMNRTLAAVEQLEQYYLSQPAVSKAMAELESDTLESRFAALEAEDDADAELRALKARRAPALPAQSSDPDKTQKL